jgi:hypothetical protein
MSVRTVRRVARHAAAIVFLILVGTAPIYAQDVTFVVTMPSANIHKAPSTGSAIIGRAQRGTTFAVKRELGSWVSIPWPDAQIGVAYLHVAWGKVSHGIAAQGRGGGGEEPQRPSAPLARPELTLPGGPAAELQAGQPPRTNTLLRPAASLPSHAIGLGGRIGTRGVGMAGTGRAWLNGPFGVQIEGSQSTYTSVDAPGELRLLQLAPTIMYSPPDLITNAIWARPYIGGGISLLRSTLSSSPGATEAVEHMLGSHLTAGVESTWANIPQFTVSADVRRQWARPTVTRLARGGFGAALSVHWYVR